MCCYAREFCDSQCRLVRLCANKYVGKMSADGPATAAGLSLGSTSSRAAAPTPGSDGGPSPQHYESDNKPPQDLGPPSTQSSPPCSVTRRSVCASTTSGEARECPSRRTMISSIRQTWSATLAGLELTHHRLAVPIPSRPKSTLRVSLHIQVKKECHGVPRQRSRTTTTASRKGTVGCRKRSRGPRIQQASALLLRPTYLG